MIHRHNDTSMTRVILYYWRLCATGLGFATFMLGSLLLTLLLFPAIKLLPIAARRKRRGILLVIHWAFKLFMRYMQWLSPLEALDVVGLHHLDPKERYLFIANHPSLADIVAIMSCVPCCSCLVKKALWDHFSMGGVVRAAGYIVTHTSAQLVHDCQRCFADGRSLIIFPEGTRSPAYGLHPFQRGAAQIALRTGVPVVPIVITYNTPTFLKGDSWFQIPEHPVRIRLEFHSPLVIPPAVHQEPSLPLQVRVLTQHWEAFFRRMIPPPPQSSGA